MTSNIEWESEAVTITTTNDLTLIGTQKIWPLPKTAFLCSDKFSAGSVLKSYDWAAEMKREERCVISGFQSKLEKDVFDILLGGSAPVIVVLARGMYKSSPQKLRPHIETGRLLIVSPFPQNIGCPNRALAFKRNQFCVDNSGEVVFAHIHAGGMLERLDTSGKLVKILDTESEMNG
jgi:hypothetical protein